MGRVNKRKGKGFKTEKQRRKLENISESLLNRWTGEPNDFLNDLSFSDHTYFYNDAGHRSRCDISQVNNEEIVDDEVNTTRSKSSLEGRYVVELAILAEGLRACQKCGNPLHLHHAKEITAFGIGAIIKVICSNTRCHHINNVPTGKRHGKVWDGNTKLVTGRKSHVTQIAAVCGEEKWSTYVTPKITISPAATKVTEISYSYQQLYFKNRPVHSISISKALDDFICFIRKQEKPILLAGHNIRVFDCPVLFNALESTGKTGDFINIVEGFLDTKFLYKNIYPELKSYSKVNLYKHIIGTDYNAHDALEDVTSLQTMLSASNLNLNNISGKPCTFTIEYATENHDFSKRVGENLPTLQFLVQSKIISAAVARKAAGSGLTFYYIKIAFIRNGIDGIRNLFVEKCGKGVRVTNCIKIINSVCDYFIALEE